VRDYIFCRWENIDKKRYYAAIVERDLLGDWGITCHWGGLDTRQGGMKRIYCESYEKALSLLDDIKSVRGKRGYILTEEK
jgi:hypothetical protein